MASKAKSKNSSKSWPAVQTSKLTSSAASTSKKRQRSPDVEEDYRSGGPDGPSKRKKKHKGKEVLGEGVKVGRRDDDVKSKNVNRDQAQDGWIGASGEKQGKTSKHRHPNYAEEREGNREKKREKGPDKRRKEKHRNQDHDSARDSSTSSSSLDTPPRHGSTTSSAAPALRQRLDLALLGQASSRSGGTSTSHMPSAFSHFGGSTKRKQAPKSKQAKPVKFGVRGNILIYWPDWTILNNDGATFERDKNRSEKQLHWMVRNGLAQEMTYLDDMTGTRIVTATQQAFGEKAPLGDFAFYKCKKGSGRMWPQFIAAKDLKDALQLQKHYTGCNWCFIVDKPGPGGFSERQKKRAERFRRRFKAETEEIKERTPLPKRRIGTQKVQSETEVSEVGEQDAEESSADAVTCIGCDFPILGSRIRAHQAQCPGFQRNSGYRMLLMSDDEEPGTESSEDSEEETGKNSVESTWHASNEDAPEAASYPVGKKKKEKGLHLPGDAEEEVMVHGDDEDEQPGNQDSGAETVRLHVKRNQTNEDSSDIEIIEPVIDLVAGTDGEQDHTATDSRGTVEDPADAVFGRIRQRMRDLDWHGDLAKLETMLNEYLKYNIEYDHSISPADYSFPRELRSNTQVEEEPEVDAAEPHRQVSSVTPAPQDQLDQGHGALESTDADSAPCKTTDISDYPTNIPLWESQAEQEGNNEESQSGTGRPSTPSSDKDEGTEDALKIHSGEKPSAANVEHAGGIRETEPTANDAMQEIRAPGKLSYTCRE